MEENFKSDSLNNAYTVLQNIVEDMKCQGPIAQVKSINQLISTSKRLRMANILYKQECKEHKSFLKKYIKKSQSSSVKKQQQQPQIQNMELKSVQKISNVYQEESRNYFPKLQNNSYNQFDSFVDMQVEEPVAPPPAPHNDIVMIQKFQDEEIRDMIRQELNVSQIKNELLEKQRNNQQESAFQSLCYQIHSISKSACNQAQGLYNKVRVQIQTILQDQNIMSFKQSSQYFKNVVDLFQLEQKKFIQSLQVLKETRNTFSLDTVKYDNQFQKHRTFIQLIERRNNKEIYLYSHELDQSKIIVSKYPSKSQEAKMGEINIGVTDINHFEIYQHPLEQDVKQLLVLTNKNKLSLSYFKTNNFQFCKQQIFYDRVLKLQHQKVQDCFAILYTDRRKIDIFDELGQKLYSFNQPDKHSILSFCFHLDHEYLHLINYLNNFSVQYNKIELDKYKQLKPSSKVFTKRISTDLYLENTKLPSDYDEPDVYFLGNNNFYLQFQNRMYILNTNDIEIGALIYENKDLIDVKIYDQIIFRIYKNDITIQYYDQGGVYSEVSIFTNPIYSLSLKQAYISRTCEKTSSFQIDIISFQNIYYTFYYTLDE